jgi:hypothetical protein
MTAPVIILHGQTTMAYLYHAPKRHWGAQGSYSAEPRAGVVILVGRNGPEYLSLLHRYQGCVLSSALSPNRWIVIINKPLRLQFIATTLPV